MSVVANLIHDDTGVSSVDLISRSRRILIVGCGGSGKTYLSIRIGNALSLRVFHLDSVFYDRQWAAKGDVEFAQAQEDLVTKHEWVIEGNYVSTLHVRLREADLVVLLDLSPSECLRGIIWRRFRHWRRQNPQTGVYNRISLGFIRYIVNYRRDTLPRVRAVIANVRPDVPLVIVQSRDDTRKLAADIDEILTCSRGADVVMP